VQAPGWLTGGVGTMWCAYAFAAIAFIGYPVALKPGGEGIIAWIAQTFRQVVLLSIIVIGQNIAATSSEALEIQKHLQSQDEELNCASPVKMYVMR
jgi:hypothetical protein